MGFIESPQRVWWRRMIFQIHLWVGILLALYVIVISITGCMMIFGDEITDDAPRISSPAPHLNPSAFDGAVTAARSLHVDYDLRSIEIASQPGKAARIEMRKSIELHGRPENIYRSLYFDACTGLIVSDFNLAGPHPVYDFIEDLHIELLAGRSPGRQINGACAALLLLLCLTGIVIWWPGRKIWKRALGVKWSAAWKRINFDSHSAVGFWALLMISVWAITGVYFGYPVLVRNALAKIMPFAENVPRPKTNWKPGEPTLATGDLYRHAQRALPGESIQRIDLPSRPGDPVYVSFLPSRSPHYLHRKSVLLSPETGDVLRIQDEWKDGKAGDHLLRMLFMLHFAEFDSLPLRIVFALLGLSPAALAITGTLMWWNRVLSKKWSLLKGDSRQASFRAPGTQLVAPASGEYGFAHVEASSNRESGCGAPADV